MAETIRFHLDEHVPSTGRDALRRHGIDVTTPSKANLVAATDETHLSFDDPAPGDCQFLSGTSS